MARRRSALSTDVPASGLAVHEAATRAQALLRERARLLRDVQKKKLQLEQVQQKTSRDAGEAMSKMAPLLQRHDALLKQLTELFAELLAPGRLAARARREVGKVRRSLELMGVVASIDEDHDDDEPVETDADEPWSARAQEARGSARGGHHHAPPPRRGGPEVAGARQVGQDKRSLRELFRNLARAVHPDQARHETERERRTEVMKEVTRAYEDGDLARLIELENAWQSERAVGGSEDSLTRCRELERINRELLDQVRQLTRQLRDARQEAREAYFGLAPDELIEQASSELDGLTEIYDFVRKFADGKLSLAEFARGPAASEQELLERLLFEELLRGRTPKPRRSRR